jgi:hypothetical protein
MCTSFSWTTENVVGKNEKKKKKNSMKIYMKKNRTQVKASYSLIKDSWRVQLVWKQV